MTSDLNLRRETMTVNRSNARTHRTRQAFTFTGLALLLATLPGCQSVNGTSPTAQVRIIDASPDGPGIDIYQGGSALAYNLGLGTITSYISTPPGIYTVNVDVSGSKQQLASARGTFSANNQYTILVGDYSTSLQATILTDQTQPAPSGDIALRFVDQSTRAGAVDVYLIPTGSTILQVRPALTNVVFGTNTGYLNIPSGTYTIAALPTGTVPTATTTTSYTGAAIAYAGGSAKTIILIDQQLITTPGLQVVIADDYDSPNAQS